MNDAYKTLEMINDCRDVEAGSIFCYCSCLADYQRRYLVGKNISVIKERVNDLTSELRSRGSNIVDNDKEQGEFMRICRSLVGQERSEVIQEITLWVLYNNNEYNHGTLMLGVYGANGVGKTEAVAHVYNRILDENQSHFNTFIWVEASYEDDLQKLQMKIANKIGLILSEDDSVQDNAILLENALLKKGKVLLVLDSMRKAFTLEEIGFPAFSNSNKIIITSRSSSLCCQMMCHKSIALKLLSNAEAYELLKDEVGYKGIRLKGKIQSSMKKIATECGGLPLAIVTTAKYLRKFSGDEQMERALERELYAFNNLKYTEEKVFKELMLSYEQLKHSSGYSPIQECFLYCTMFPRNCLMMTKRLMEYWIWEGLLGEVEMECMDEKLREAEGILDELKDACFLVSVRHDKELGEIVKMHPLIWDMAVHIGKGNPRFFTKAGRKPGNGKDLYKDWPEDVERVSLMQNINMKELRSGPMFCKLSTLFLHDNPIDILIVNDFFNSFPNLKLLNLSNTGVTTLPDSISSLKHLTILLLRNCRGLTYLPSLSQLVALMVLDISGSPIAELPPGINHLTKLIRLNLSHTRVRLFPLHFLISLYNLQELLMIGCDLTWVLRSLEQEDGAACIEDIQELGHLKVLQITFASLQIFHNYISSKHWCWLKAFRFCVGGLYNGKLGNKSLALMKQFPADPLWLPSDTSDLLVMHCDDITTIPKFQNLKFLDVSFCKNLKHLFEYAVWLEFGNLEELVVSHCPNLERIIEKEDEESNEDISWGRLRKLMLFNLPELRLMCNVETKCDTMQTIGIWNCSKLEKFPISFSFGPQEKLASPQGLKEIRGDKSWLRNLTRTSKRATLAFLAEALIEEPPPEELQSRGEMQGNLSIEPTKEELAGNSDNKLILNSPKP